MTDQELVDAMHSAWTAYQAAVARRVRAQQIDAQIDQTQAAYLAALAALRSQVEV